MKTYARRVYVEWSYERGKRAAKEGLMPGCVDETQHTLASLEAYQKGYWEEMKCKLATVRASTAPRPSSSGGSEG